MKIRIDYQIEGYQDGLTDAKRTGGRVSQKYINNLFKCKALELTPDDSCMYVKGWEDGFADGIRGTLKKMVSKDSVVKRKCCSFV
jgi:hypothetical protein